MAANQSDVRLTVKTHPKLLRPVRALVHSYACASGFSRERADDIMLAVDEACANILRHSYCNACDKLLTLSLNAAKGWFEVVLEDEGMTAPPDRIERRPPEPPDIVTLRPGGLGVQLMYSVFDEVVFTPVSPRGNRVLMRAAIPETMNGTSYGAGISSAG